MKIEVIHKPCRVYDLEIEDNHNFALAAGVFVHNSKDMSDSLAGALWNATLHKQSLIDGLELLESALAVNDISNPQQEFMDNFQQSLLASNKSLAQTKMDELLSGYDNKDIIIW